MTKQRLLVINKGGIKAFVAGVIENDMLKYENITYLNLCKKNKISGY